MLIRKTSTTVKKRIFRGKLEDHKTAALYRVVTYWLLFIPIYSYQELID